MPYGCLRDASRALRIMLPGRALDARGMILADALWMPNEWRAIFLEALPPGLNAWAFEALKHGCSLQR